MVPPDRPDFTGGNRNRAHTLYALNESLELVYRLVRPQRGLVADDDGVDVGVATSKGDRGREFTAASRTVSTNCVGIRAEDLQVGADLLGRRAVAVVRML